MLKEKRKCRVCGSSKMLMHRDCSHVYADERVKIVLRFMNPEEDICQKCLAVFQTKCLEALGYE